MEQECGQNIISLTLLTQQIRNEDTPVLYVFSRIRPLTVCGSVCIKFFNSVRCVIFNVVKLMNDIFQQQHISKDTS